MTINIKVVGDFVTENIGCLDPLERLGPSQLWGLYPLMVALVVKTYVTD